MVKDPERRVILFPSDQKERKRILRESEDRRVRICTLMRSVCGWLLLIAVFFFFLFHYSLFTPSSLRTLAGYATAGLRQQEGDRAVITYPNSSFSDAELFGSSLAFVDSDTLYIARPGSAVSLQQQLSYSNSVLETGGDYVFCYDRGGTQATLFNSVAPAAQVTLQSPIISGAMSESGNFVLVTDEQGYRTAATIFNKEGKEVFKWSSSEYYIVSAALSSDGKTMAATAFLQNGVSLDSHVMYFSIGKDEVQADCTLPDTLGMQLAFLSDGAVSVLCDTGVYRVDSKANAVAILPYSMSDLLCFRFSENRLALAQRSYSGTNRCEIRVLRANGDLSDPIYCSEEPTSLAVSSAGVAALTASGVSVYSFNGDLLWSNADAVGARQILFSDDGTVYALYGKNARLFTDSSDRSEEPSHDTAATS